MQPHDLAYLRHMRDFCLQVADFVDGVEEAQWCQQLQLRLAVTHTVQMIGEAARKVSPAGRAACPALPWNEIVGMRHRIVHEYMSVDFDIVWQVAVQDLPALRLGHDAIVSQLEGD